MDSFAELRNRISMEEAVRRYGFELDRRRRILCPFHADHSPSLQLYGGGRGWWCFVCGEGGSVIDFAARLFRLSPLEAAKKLDADFGLGLFSGSRERRGERPSRLRLQRERHERLRKKLCADREKKELLARIERRRELWLKKAPPPDAPRDDPRWGEYAAGLGELEYLDECCLNCLSCLNGLEGR